MGEKGRSRFQRAFGLVQGALLVAFGVLVLSNSTWVVARLLGRISEYHSFLQYAGLGACVLLGLIGVVYIKMGMTLCRHRPEIPRWRMLLGLLAGLEIWYVLAFWAWILVVFLSIYHWEHFHWLRDGIPVLVGGGVAGYIARQGGLVLGGIIGPIHQLHVVLMIWATWQPSGTIRPPKYPVTEIIHAHGLLRALLISTLIVTLIGMASGHLGQFLVHRVLRSRNQSDQKTPSVSGET